MNEHIENARNVVNGWATVLAADAEAQAAIVARQQQAARELGDASKALAEMWPIGGEHVPNVRKMVATNDTESPQGESVDEQVQRELHIIRAAVNRMEALLVQRRIQPVEYKELS